MAGLFETAAVPALLQTLFDDHVVVLSKNDRQDGAARLDLKAFHAFTLQRADVDCETHTIEKEVEALSRHDGIEFKASIWPGYGFHPDKGGFWPAHHLHDFLPGCMVIFIGGFNDFRYGGTADEETVCKAVDDHVDWLKWFDGCEIAFTEVNDSHGNEVPWLTSRFREIASKDSRVSVHTATFPKDQWASDYFRDDTYHLTKEGLLSWLSPELRNYAVHIAKTKRRVLFVTDSTFEAHEYKTSWARGGDTSSISIQVRTLTGDGMKLSVKVSDTVAMLKEQISRENPTLTRQKIVLRHAGKSLHEQNTLEHYHLSDGATLFMRQGSDTSAVAIDASSVCLLAGCAKPTWNSKPNGFCSRTCKEQAALVAPAAEVFFFDDKFFDASAHYDYKVVGLQKMAVRVKGEYDGGNNSWLRKTGEDAGAWYTSFHSTGRHESATMAEDGYSLCYQERGIYSTPDLRLAFMYAPRMEHGGKTYFAVIQNRVNPAKIKRTKTDNGEFWIVPGEDDIRPYGIVLLDEEAYKNGPEHGEGFPRGRSSADGQGRGHGKGHGKSGRGHGKGHDKGQAHGRGHCPGAYGPSSASTCLKSGCGKPTYNGKPNEYCSKEHRREAAGGNAVCLKPGCGKPTFNGKPNGYCTLAHKP